MKVLIAHNTYRAYGGEDRHVALLAAALSDADIDVRLYVRDAAHLERSLLKRLCAGAMLAYSPGAAGIDEELHGWRPDVVHFHNLWPLLTPSALRRAKRHGAAVVVTAHNSRFACPGGTCTVEAHPAQDGLFDNPCLAGSALRCALVNNPRASRSESVAYGIAIELHQRLRMLERWTDAFIAPSQYIAEMLRSAGIPLKRIHMIPNGVSAGGENATNSASEFALFVGRLSPEKGLRTLIEAAKLAPVVPIAAAGTGPLQEELRSSQIRALGQLDRERLDEAIRRAAFTILPSECHENAPYSLLESFSLAKPAIASRVGGIPEIVQHEQTGLLVAPRDPSALAHGIVRLWHDRGLTAALGSNALRWAQERLSLAHQVDRTIDLYDRCGSRRGPSRIATKAPRARIAPAADSVVVQHPRGE